VTSSTSTASQPAKARKRRKRTKKPESAESPNTIPNVEELTERQFVPVHSIFPSPENETIYKPIVASDPANIELAESVKENGVLQPIGITMDNFIVDGHRRHLAARIAELQVVPIRFEPFYRLDDNGNVRPDFVAKLREFNRQRVKSLDEVLREAVVESDPEEAYESLIAHRKAKAKVNVETMDIREGKQRVKVSEGKQPMLKACQDIVAEFTKKDLLPLSDRRMHYLLAQHYKPPLHTSRPKIRYGLNDASYAALTRLLTAARFEGSIPWEAIGDETRPVTIWRVHDNPQPFLAEQVGGLFKGYWRNLMQSQPCRIEIFGEKNTVGPIIRPVAGRFTIPVTLGRGFCSSPPRHDLAVRFKKSGKDRLIILLVTDFDPPGQEIAHSFARSMRDEFDIDNIDAVQVALTRDQVDNFKLPSGGKAKPKSQGYARFVQQYGDQVYELEALAPELLQKLLQDAIDSVIDHRAFNHELDAEKQDAAFLANKRNLARAALSEIG